MTGKYNDTWSGARRREGHNCDQKEARAGYWHSDLVNLLQSFPWLISPVEKLYPVTVVRRARQLPPMVYWHSSPSDIAHSQFYCNCSASTICTPLSAVFVSSHCTFLQATVSFTLLCWMEIWKLSSIWYQRVLTSTSRWSAVLSTRRAWSCYPINFRRQMKSIEVSAIYVPQCYLCTSVGEKV